VEGINVLNNHEGNCQLEQSGVKKLTHLNIILPEKRKNSIDLLNLAIPYTQLILVAVVGQIHTID